MLSHSLLMKLRYHMLSYMNEVDPFIFCCMFFHELKNCIFYVLFQKWYQSGLQSHVCITFWVSFRIKENSAVDFFAFLVLELWFDKTEIDVMILFRFDFNHAILNFKTIASMKFSFDLDLILIWSINYVLSKWNVKKWFPEKSKKFSFTSFDWLRIPFDRMNVPFDQSNRNWESIDLSRNFMMNFFNFLIDREFLLIDWICLLIYRTGIESRLSHPKTSK